jgi:hydrogenase maturation factor
MLDLYHIIFHNSSGWYDGRMCLSVPREIIKVDGRRAWLEDGREVKLDLIKQEVKPHDFVLVNANLAIEKISKARVRDMKLLLDSEQDIVNNGK